jgi:hypothetical protein
VCSRKRHPTRTGELDRDVPKTGLAGNPEQIGVEQSRLMRRIVSVSKRRKMLFRQERTETDEAALIRSAQQNPAAGLCDPRELPAEGTGIFEVFDRLERNRDVSGRVWHRNPIVVQISLDEGRLRRESVVTRGIDADVGVNHPGKPRIKPSPAAADVYHRAARGPTAKRRHCRFVYRVAAVTQTLSCPRLQLIVARVNHAAVVIRIDANAASI